MRSKADIYIKFFSPELTLFDLGYLTTDLLHLALIGSFVDRSNYKALEKLYFPRGSYKYPTRYQMGSFANEFRKDIRVGRVSEGSLELLIAGASLAASIIMPVSLYSASKKNEIIESERELINVTVDCDDPDVHQILRLLEDNRNGGFDNNFNFLRYYLHEKGMSFMALDGKVFHVTQCTTNRLAKTLTTTYRIPKG